MADLCSSSSVHLPCAVYGFFGYHNACGRVDTVRKYPYLPMPYVPGSRSKFENFTSVTFVYSL